MPQSRRRFLMTAAATAGAVGLSPRLVTAQAAKDSFDTSAGPILISPVSHASFVMETPAGVIYADPVGEPSAYGSLPPADLIMVTHEHGDHFNAETLAALVGDNTTLITNPSVFDKLPEDLKAKASAIANGESTSFGSVGLDAIPAYNTTAERLNFHPQGRDNGYVLTFGDFRVYVSGDTEDTPEMRALEGINLAFLCMNLPFTMDAEAAASAVQEFRPAVVYPYHYRGRDGGTQDPQKFAELVGDASEVKMGNWYG